MEPRSPVSGSRPGAPGRKAGPLRLRSGQAFDTFPLRLRSLRMTGFLDGRKIPGRSDGASDAQPWERLLNPNHLHW